MQNFNYKHYLNLIYLFFFVFFVIFFSFSVNYESLVDPVYYVNAASYSVSVPLAFQYGERWATDIGFILFTYFIRLLFSSSNSIACAYVLGLVFLYTIALCHVAKTRYFFLVVFSVFVSFSTIGLLFNVWRQAYGVLIILMTIFCEKKSNKFLLVLLASTFHLNTAIFFVIPVLVDNVSYRKLIVWLLPTFVIILFVFSLLPSNAFWGIQDAVQVYSNLDSSSALYRYLYCIFIFSSVTLTALYYNGVGVIDGYTFRLVTFSIIIAGLFYIQMPTAAERFLHYFFCLFPFYVNCMLCNVRSRMGFLIMFLLFFIHVSLSVYLLFQTQVWSILHVRHFL